MTTLPGLEPEEQRNELREIGDFCLLLIDPRECNSSMIGIVSGVDRLRGELSDQFALEEEIQQAGKHYSIFWTIPPIPKYALVKVELCSNQKSNGETKLVKLEAECQLVSHREIADMGDDNGRADFTVVEAMYEIEIEPKHPNTDEWIDWPGDRVLTEVRLIRRAEQVGDGKPDPVSN